METQKEQKLLAIVEASGLKESNSKIILDNFTGFFESAKKWEIEAKGINVTDVSQTDMMTKAREVRLQLKDIRVNAEKVRKELKEQSLREGKAIDGIANVIKALIVPLEEHLEKQEKFVEYKLERELSDRHNKRIVELSPYVEDVAFYNLRNMDEDSYQLLLKSSKEAHEAQLKAEEEAEKERARLEEEDRKERIRIQKENEKLREEARKKELEIAKIRKEEEEKRRIENEKREAQEEKLREEARKKKDDLEAQMYAELPFLFESMELTSDGQKVYKFVIKMLGN